MGVLDFIQGLAGSANPITSIAAAAKGLISVIRGKLPPEEQSAADMALLQLEAEQYKAQSQFELELQRSYAGDMANLREQAKVELTNEDWFVRRARPAWLWGLLSVYMMAYGLVPFFLICRGIWTGIPMVYAPVELPTDVHVLTGGVVLGISYLRSMDKGTIIGRGGMTAGK